MDGDVHDEIEDRPEGGDASEVEEHGECDGEGNRVDHGVHPNRAWHSEVAVGDLFHVGEHRQHP